MSCEACYIPGDNDCHQVFPVFGQSKYKRSMMFHSMQVRAEQSNVTVQLEGCLMDLMLDSNISKCLTKYTSLTNGYVAIQFSVRHRDNIDEFIDKLRILFMFDHIHDIYVVAIYEKRLISQGP